MLVIALQLTVLVIIARPSYAKEAFTGDIHPQHLSRRRGSAPMSALVPWHRHGMHGQLGWTTGAQRARSRHRPRKYRHSVPKSLARKHLPGLTYRRHSVSLRPSRGVVGFDSVDTCFQRRSTRIGPVSNNRHRAHVRASHAPRRRRRTETASRPWRSIAVTIGCVQPTRTERASVSATVHTPGSMPPMIQAPHKLDTQVAALSYPRQSIRANLCKARHYTGPLRFLEHA